MVALEGSDSKTCFGARVPGIGFHAHGTLFLHAGLLHGPLMGSSRAAGTARPFVHVCAEPIQAPDRRVPADYSYSDKEQYLQIALRAQSESVNSYSVLCLGLQTFLDSRKLARTAASQNA